MFVRSSDLSTVTVWSQHHKIRCVRTIRRKNSLDNLPGSLTTAAEKRGNLPPRLTRAAARRENIGTWSCAVYWTRTAWSRTLKAEASLRTLLPCRCSVKPSCSSSARCLWSCACLLRYDLYRSSRPTFASVSSLRTPATFCGSEESSSWTTPNAACRFCFTHSTTTGSVSVYSCSTLASELESCAASSASARTSFNAAVSTAVAPERWVQMPYSHSRTHAARCAV
eukprot:1613690-Rhodomonas_salina.1